MASRWDSGMHHVYWLCLARIPSQLSLETMALSYESL